MQRGFDFNPHIESVKAPLLINAHFVGDGLAFTKLFAWLLRKVHALFCCPNFRISRYG